MEKVINELKKLNKKAIKNSEVPVSALIVCDGKIISKAYNRRNKTNKIINHAEIEAILKASKKKKTWILDDCDLYVTLEPCPMCAGACVNARVSRVVYGARNYRSGAGGTLYNILRDSRLNHMCKVEAGIMENECVKILQDYFIQRRVKRS